MLKLLLIPGDIVLFMPQCKIKSGHGFPTGKQSKSKQIIFLKAFGIRIILNLKCIKETLNNNKKLSLITS